MNLLRQANFIASLKVCHLCNHHNYRCQSCTPKQIDLQVFLLLQLPYCVSVVLLTSRCKSAAAKYKRCYYFAPTQSILTKQM